MSERCANCGNVPNPDGRCACGVCLVAPDHPSSIDADLEAIMGVSAAAAAKRYGHQPRHCPLLSTLDTVNGTPLEIIESIPGMVRAAAHECGKVPPEKCEDGHCIVGYVHDFSDSEMFNLNDVYMVDSGFPERVASGNGSHDSLRVWIFGFCPK
jgi:hypothetical protein